MVITFSHRRTEYLSAAGRKLVQATRVPALGKYLPEGRYELRIPYRDSRLVMDFMRHDAHVEVIEPSAPRDEVRQQFETAARQYS